MKLTIGLPFYNSENTIADAIRSIFASNYSDWELLLVDDGSTDRSLEIASSVSDSRVSVISDGVNRGLSYRLNQIAERAKGEYIARMDADDLMHPDRLTKQVGYLDANLSVDLVTTGAFIIDELNMVKGVRGLDEPSSEPYRILSNGLLIHPCVTGKVGWFRANPYNERFKRAEDRELWCRTYSQTNIAMIKEPLYFYRDGYSLLTSIENYRESCNSEYRIIKTYGPNAIGTRKTAFLMFRTLIKSFAYSVATSAGMQQVLLTKRNKKLSDQQYYIAKSALERIFSTSLPYLDQP